MIGERDEGESRRIIQEYNNIKMFHLEHDFVIWPIMQLFFCYTEQIIYNKAND